MTRIGSLAILGAALVVALIGAAAARPGKVVRVERRPATSDRPITICHAMLGGRDQLTCLAGDVATSETLHLISTQGGYERLEVIDRRPSSLDTCKLGILFDVKIRATTRQSSIGHRDSFALGGVEVVPGKSRLMSPQNIAPPAPGLEVGIAVDLLGDGRPDLIAASRKCPETQSAERGLYGKTVLQSVCLSLWERSPRTRGWRKKSETALHFCR